MTNSELKKRIESYNAYSAKAKELEAIKKELQKEILEELDNRGTDTFEGYCLITERLTENATKEGKQALKEMFAETIDKYINVSLSRFINGRNAKKVTS